MKKRFLLALVVCTSLIPLCSIASSTPIKANGNAIVINNDSGQDIVYSVASGWDVEYFIRKGGSDVYHSKDDDNYATINAGLCLQNNRDVCTQPASVRNCINGQHYNADLIDTITIYPNLSCSVTCLGGGNSCKQS